MGVKNVLIPLELLNEIAELLYYSDASLYDSPLNCRYTPVMEAIINKLISVGLHDAYSRAVAKIGPTAAKNDYLRLKQIYDSLKP